MDNTHHETAPRDVGDDGGGEGDSPDEGDGTDEGGSVAGGESVETSGPDGAGRVPGSPVLESLLENARTRRDLGERLDASGDRVDRDELGDVVRHGPVLEALLDEPLDRGEVEARLDVSRATSHRFVRWLEGRGYAEKVDGRYRLTGRGEVVAEELLRFEANVRTADRLAPLLDAVCGDHREFVVEPFVDATVTVADPACPYEPVERFLSLLRDSETFRGFNTTHMAPLVLGEFQEQVFSDTDSEIVYLPDVAATLFETHPEQAREAVERSHLTLRTREALPYGLALFDDRVGIGGYDESTGQMQVFVDTDSPIAREWAERVYRSVRADSRPLEPPTE